MFSFFLGIFYSGFGQKSAPPAISQYMFNPLSSNPAYAGFYDMTIASNLFRGQVAGGQGFKLFTNTLNIHSSLPIDKMGAGLNVTYDQTGITRAFNIDLSMSYKLVFGSNKLSLGAQGTFFSAKNDFDLLKYNNDSNGNADDAYKNAFTPQNTSAITRPNFGIGMMYSGRKFFGSLSIPRILSIVKEDQFITVSDSTVNYNTKYKSYATASIGKIIHIKDAYELKPSIMVKSVDGLGTLIDANCSILYKQTIWLGTSIRNSISASPDKSTRIFTAFNTVALMAQAQVSDKIKVGFSYDIMLNSQAIRSQKGFNAPIEIMASYNLAIFEEQGVHTFLF